MGAGFVEGEREVSPMIETTITTIAAVWEKGGERWLEKKERKRKRKENELITLLVEIHLVVSISVLTSPNKIVNLLFKS